MFLPVAVSEKWRFEFVDFLIFEAELRNSQIICYSGRWCRMWYLLNS